MSRSPNPSSTLQQDTHGRSLSRRSLMAGAVAGLAALAAPSLVRAAPLPLHKPDAPYSISLLNTHTDERLTNVVFAEGDRFNEDALAAINHLLRDHRTDEQAVYDRDLLKLLVDIKDLTGTSKPFHVVSAYRSPETNAMLRRAGAGAAKNSYHIHAMAVDIRVPGVRLSHLRRAALHLGRGGVGYYPRSNFLHVDTGRVRSWG